MAPSDTPKRQFSPRALVIAGLIITLLLAAIAALVAPKEPSATRRALEAKFAELRVKGVPVTAQEIGRSLPDPPPERDARILLAEAFRFSPGPVGKNVPVLTKDMDMAHRGGPIPEAMMQDMEAFLANSDRLLAAIPDDLTGVRFSMGWTNGFTNLLPSVLIDLRQLHQQLAVKALYESGRGDAARAAQSLTKGFAVAASVNGDTLVDVMIRVACAGLMCDAAEQALNRVQFITEDLHKIDVQVKPEVIDNFDDTFRIERHLGVLQFNHMRESTRGLRGIYLNLVQRFKGRYSAVYRDEDYLLFLHFSDQQTKLHSLPLLQRVRGYEQITSTFKTNATSLAANMVMPSWSKAMRTAAETKARLVALKTALAIERFRLANNNSLPPTLDALVPNFCSSAPRDPFDEQPLRYKKLPSGYVVYSIGADGIDNAGAERSNRKNMSDYDLTITVEPEP
jgi:type II secretory pathway pseudopilin PulG